MPRHHNARREQCHGRSAHRACASAHTAYNFCRTKGYPTGGFDPGCEGAKASAAAPSVFSGLPMSDGGPR